MSFSKEIRWMVVLSTLFHLLFIFISIHYSLYQKKNFTIVPRRYTLVSLVELPKSKIKAKPIKIKKVKTVKKKRVKPRIKPKKIKPVRKKSKIQKTHNKRKKKKKKGIKKVEKKNEFLEKLKALEALEDKWAKSEKENRLAVKEDGKENITYNSELAQKLRSLREKWERQKKKPFPSTLKTTNPIRIDSADFSDKYLAVLQASIDGNWAIPVKKSEYKGKKLVVVFFKIYRNGAIKDVKIEKSTGINALDLSAKKAVLDTKYLPSLPDDFKEEYLGVHFSFLYSYAD